jgi:hypothetical protein
MGHLKMKIIHTLTALALCAPIFAFYFVIAGEAIGWQPIEPALLVTRTTLAQACSAWAKSKGEP